MAKSLKKQIKKEIEKPVNVKEFDTVIKPVKMLLPTGSTLLNLACSDKSEGGYGTGRIVNLIGDSDTGKSVLSLTMLADLCYDESFDDYQLIYDDVEQAYTFDKEYMFSKKVNKRIIMEESHSDLIKDWRDRIFKLCDKDKHFV